MSLSPKPTKPFKDVQYDAWFQSIQTWLGPQGQTGSTAIRPTVNLYVGLSYFDTTLGYPVFVKQVSPSIIWVNGSGTPV
jgi:hypothetical protein